MPSGDIHMRPCFTKAFFFFFRAFTLFSHEQVLVVTNLEPNVYDLTVIVTAVLTASGCIVIFGSALHVGCSSEIDFNPLVF